MATLNILPNADVANSPAWTIGTGSDVYAMLDDDDTGHVTSDSSDIEATAYAATCLVEMEDHGLAGGTTINSVQAVVKHNNRGRGTTYTIQVKILDNSGGVYYTENISGSGSSSWLTATLTSRSTSDGSTAWSLGEIDGLRMGLRLAAISGGTVGITYAYFIIDYTAGAPAAADNATFFGANF
jgi:hypothetical protein